VTGDREQVTGNREQGTGNREQVIGNILLSSFFFLLPPELLNS
jgi:hypothetical protein